MRYTELCEPGAHCTYKVALEAALKIVDYILLEGFLQGVNSYRRGEQLQDYSDNTRMQIRYEIGRQVAVFYKGPVKQGRQAHPECVQAVAWLYQNNFLRP